MSAPSMVHRSGDTLVVRSVVSGDALFGETAAEQQTADDEVVDEKDLPECKIKRNYSCTACDYFTQNPRHYLYHLRDVHKEKVKIYECPNCLYASKHFQKLLRHTKMVHGSTDGVEMPEFSRSKKKPQRLDGSPSDVQIQEESEEEEEMSEGEEKTASVLKCSLCSFTARSQQALTKHGKEEHIKTKFFRCTKCTYVTHMKARFTKHVKYHSMPMIKCDLCDFRTPYKWNLDRHCKNHNGQGAFRCSACNFTADIKQSLTVHEMNHHVPPVGQAAGLGVGRRRNKVGASDAVAAEEAAQRTNEPDSTGDDTNRTNKPSSPQTPKPKQPPAKKQKTTPTQSNQEQRTSFGSDFIHPDDFIHHANGNIYIKNKCKLCNFKSAWDGGMARHEKKAHNIVRGGAPAQVKGAKKTPRPVPNLIPIPKGVKSVKQEEEDEEEVVEVMSQKDMNDICAKSANSALKDFASLFGSEDVFKDSVEDTKPTDLSSKPPPKEPDDTPLSTPKQPSSKQQQGLSFFDRLGEKLRTENSRNNLTCQYCGHESKCLTHFVCHQKVCGKEMVPTHAAVSLLVSSTRCQYCRQRCKSSTDLYNHLMTCREAAKAAKVKEEDEEEEGCDDEDTVKVKTEVTTTETYVTNVEPSETLVEAPVHVKTEEPHPMENRVFVWNNIEVPMDIEVDETAHYEYQEDAKTDDNVSSYDLSIRTQSPESESSFVSAEVVQNTVTTDKIPTHGNDISVAQHKRVFKCPHCSFWASTASRFHVHIVGHLNKKPFECSLCAYRSNWRWDITKHIKLKSVRDPAHEAAKVLMTDETGRRNYTKYNKYLTEIHMSGDQSETSGGSGTRPKHHDGGKERASPGNKAELPKLTRAPSSSDFSPLLRGSPLRPPPPLKAADAFFAKMNEKKRSTADKKTLWKCKKCNFRDPSHEKLLAHVKGHYVQAGVATTTTSGTPVQQQQQQQLDQQQHHHQLSGGEPDGDERHCRLKHGGDIRVVIGGKNGLEKLETDDQADEPDHIDQPQFGTFKCNKCPFSNDDHDEFERHLSHHSHNNDTIKCHYCPYYVSKREDLYEHLRLHGVAEPEEFAGGGAGEGKRYKCATCPYITNSKSQFLYHRQFHKPRGGQYTCLYCSYNVSKRHLLHQHLKVHGIVGSPRTNGESGGDVSEEIEEVASGLDEEEIGSSIPLVWVSKGGKFSKMFRCRYCPHVNLRKVNIQEHEKMHSSREKGRGDMEHHCSECNYVCNNAGVLSAHSKVHQGLNGKVHGLVDPTKSDEEQIRELALEEEDLEENLEENLEQTESNTMYFCGLCPARFLQEKEHSIHNRFHGLRLFYKCEYCSYTARQKPYLLAHTKVHTHSYQERSRELRTVYQVSQDHPPPTLNVLTEQNGNKIYITNEPEYKPPKLTNVPISGTELYQQRNEAQKLVQKPVDPQFGTLMHGNPDFVYPTYLKNGRMKEKRYKCHKCPSAFEKREQYKVHLSLHGSKQRYKCDHCDYSVKYFANFVQHERKHQMNAEAIAAKKSDSPEPTPTEDSSPPPLQAPSTVDDKKQIFWCPNCPYTNHRRDAVENHQKRHVSVSGLASNFTCEHCDYSVPQAHFLREHSRLHFGPSRVHQTDGFLECEGMKLVARRAGDDSSDADSVVFEDEGGRFAPPLGEDVTDRFNNNEGEKRFVDRSGDVVGVKVEEDGGGVSGGVDEN